MNKYIIAINKWCVRSSGSVFMIAVVFVVLFFIIKTFVSDNTSHCLLITGTAISIACAISLFTAELIVSDDTPYLDRRIARWVLAVGYIFLIATTCVALALMFFDNDSQKQAFAQNGNEISTREEESVLLKYLPLLVYGCKYQAPAENKDSDAQEGDDASGSTVIMPVTIPANLKYCGKTEPQRMLVLGGVLTKCSLTNSCAAADAPEPATPDPKKLRENDFYFDQKNCSTNIDTLLSMKAPHPCATTELLKRVDRRLQKAKKANLSNQTIERFGLNEALDEDADRDRIAKLIELENLVEARIEQKEVLDSHYEISNYVKGKLIVGGIVVPVYFIFCALLGAMIAMARKLPEFQARLKRSEKDTNEKIFRGEPYAPITYSELPELVLFQIIQVASAPILAVIAYGYLNDDFESQYTGISIAFAAGFSSEWVLMMIRSISDRLGGAKPKTVPSRAVTTEADSQSYINLKSGRAYRYDIVVLTQPVGQLTAGCEVVITQINSNQITAKESGGEIRFTRSADFFDVKKDLPDYVSISGNESKADG